MERRDLYEDDLTDERQPTPAQRDNVARTEILDPDQPVAIDDVDEKEDEDLEDELDD
jgi:hypothetical protein